MYFHHQWAEIFIFANMRADIFFSKTYQPPLKVDWSLPKFDKQNSYMGGGGGLSVRNVNISYTCIHYGSLQHVPQCIFITIIRYIRSSSNSCNVSEATFDKPQPNEYQKQ